MDRKRNCDASACCNTNIKLVIGPLALIFSGLLVAVIVLSLNKPDTLNEVPLPCTPSKTSRDPSFSDSNDLFRDLSKDEIVRVREYVLNEASLNVTPHSKASIASNYIFLIELMNPDKDEALAYLDGGGGKKPKRLARVVIFSGALTPPIVQEILVPVHEPKNHVVHSPGRKNPIPFLYRPFDSMEFNAIQSVIDIFTRHASKFMLERFGMDCNGSCTTFVPGVPWSEQADGRMWLRLHRLVPGFTTHPLPVELFMQVTGNDVRNWAVKKVFYHNVVFDSVQNFMANYADRNISMVYQSPPEERFSYSSLEQRGHIEPSSPKLEPRSYEPGGKRYTAEENHVEYMGWSFDFRIRSSSGPQLFDIRFNNTRIIYELSLQEAAAFYGGFSPVPLFTDYLDSSWASGKTFELVNGIDCPVTSSYFDVIAFVDSGHVTRRRNAICVFELNTGAPLRRHYEFDGQASYAFYGGMPNTALVFRTIITPFNYDYTYDYIFYQNGVIEVKVTSAGYIMSAFWTSEERRFSTRVQEDVAASIHDHLFHFKVDLDIAGVRENSFELIRSKVNKTTRWSQDGAYHYEKYFERDQKKTEKAAAYTYDFQTPSYLNFYNEAAKNSHGVRRGYRIQLNGIMKQMYPENWAYTRAIRWSHNQLVVTKYKKNETRSSTIYNQMGFYDPMVDFGQFIDDNEDISNEDLVSWVTVGVMHLPSSEDLPITTTVGNSAGFLLRPYNYFNEDPSVASRDGVVITPSGKASNVKRSERNGLSSCVSRDEPIVYSGRFDVLD